jgi:hypothetical protein
MRNWMRGQFFPSSCAFTPCGRSHQVADDIDVLLALLAVMFVFRRPLSLARLWRSLDPNPKDTGISKATPAWN